jgi:hypothetical protein
MTIAVHKRNRPIRTFDRDMTTALSASLLVTGALYKMTEVTIGTPLGQLILPFLMRR